VARVGTGRARAGRHQPRHGPAAVRDHHLSALAHLFEQHRELLPRLADSRALHGGNCATSSTFSQGPCIGIPRTRCSPLGAGTQSGSCPLRWPSTPPAHGDRRPRPPGIAMQLQTATPEGPARVEPPAGSSSIRWLTRPRAPVSNGASPQGCGARAGPAGSPCRAIHDTNGGSHDEANRNARSRSALLFATAARAQISSPPHAPG